MPGSYVHRQKYRQLMHEVVRLKGKNKRLRNALTTAKALISDMVDHITVVSPDASAWVDKGGLADRVDAWEIAPNPPPEEE